MGRHDVRLVCFHKAKETTTECLKCDRQHQDVPLCLSYLCAQRLLDCPCIPQQSLRQKESWDEVDNPQGLTMDYHDARRTLDDIEDCQIKLCLLGCRLGWIG